MVEKQRDQREKLVSGACIIEERTMFHGGTNELNDEEQKKRFTVIHGPQMAHII